MLKIDLIKKNMKITNLTICLFFGRTSTELYSDNHKTFVPTFLLNFDDRLAKKKACTYPFYLCNSMISYISLKHSLILYETFLVKAWDLDTSQKYEILWQ